MHALDHLVYAAPDLERAIHTLEALLGVRAAPGGRHPDWGTHNALLALGGRRYLEIIALEPGGASGTPRPFGLDHLETARLETWAARAGDLRGAVERARRAGVALGAVADRSRRRADGVVLRWSMTDPLAARLGGVVPFLLDWGDTPHPAADAPRGCRLLALRAEHPEPDRVRAALRSLDLELRVDRGDAPALIAVLHGARSPVELR